jgi:hypothetical protein
VTLVTPNGSSLELASNSEISLGANGAARVSSGSLSCMNRHGDIRRIITPSGQIDLLGTTVDATVSNEATTVTVINGKVDLRNTHGEALVAAGSEAHLVAAQTPDHGVPVNPDKIPVITAPKTAWYDGRNEMVSDTGEMVWVESCRGMSVQGIWTMNLDGSKKHCVTTFHLGGRQLGPWLPNSEWFLAPVNAFRPVEFLSTHGQSSRPARTAECNQIWLINAATSRTIPINLPPECVPSDLLFLSPNCHLIAFTSWHTTCTGLWHMDL